MVSTSGHRLLSEDAEKYLLDMLPLATVLTPNVPEACLLDYKGHHREICAEPIANFCEMKQLAKDVQSLGPQAVLLKGGHVPLDSDYQKTDQTGGSGGPGIVVDILCDGGELITRETPYSTSGNTHGTGCSLASALAANLAWNKPLHQAVQDACQYVETAIRTGFELGHGNGPINHFHPLYTTCRSKSFPKSNSQSDHPR
jgi:hydroxymethylpyrimidine kinase/phosphomethylpyrimidine kinase